MANQDCPLCGITARKIADTHTGAWRLERPVVAVDQCISCGICENYCPLGVIVCEKDCPAVIDYVYCKGCGICTTVCPKQAISLLLESAADGQGERE